MKKRGNATALAVIAALLSAALLLGCGAAGDDRKMLQALSGETTPSATVVGMKICVQCHYIKTAEWLQSPHANLDPSNPSNLNYAGKPTDAQVDPAQNGNDTTCKPCHDLDTDSANQIAGVTGASGVLRPVVGCEACHGGGSNHYGTGPIGPYRVSASTLTASVKTTGATVDVTANNTFTRTDGGDFTVDGFLTGLTISTSGFTDAANNGAFQIANVAATTITTTTTTLVNEVGTGDELIVSDPITASSQLNTCTACHELLTAGGITKATATHRTGGASPPNDDAFNITDTHFAMPGVYTGSNGANVSNISGYAMDFSNENVCSNCHNSHNAGRIDINREWALSKHADKTAAGAWAHYKWDRTDRTTCQRCKATTAAVAYADALAAGNTGLASGIQSGSTPPMTPSNTAPYKPQMLLCNGCHKDNRGSLRNPGPYTATYGTVSHQFANLGGSNVCVPCHSGRNNGEYVKTLNSGFLLKPFGDVDTHYLTAAGTMFTAIGYEYAGRGYANPSAYKHDRIGTGALSIDSGTNGPCVGCHMYRSGAAGNHLFRALNVGGGVITGITSDVCFNTTCHPGSNGALKDIAEAEREEFEHALEILAVQLQENGFKPYTTTNNTDPIIPMTNISYPYFGTATFGAGLNVVWDTTLDDTGNTTGKNNIGAALNFNMLHHEPGAYVHNSKYTKRLLYDSLDWLDDNMLNYSVGESIQVLTDTVTGVNLDAGSPTIRESAEAYLLPYGSLWTGIYPAGYGNPAERP